MSIRDAAKGIFEGLSSLLEVIFGGGSEPSADPSEGLHYDAETGEYDALRQPGKHYSSDAPGRSDQ